MVQYFVGLIPIDRSVAATPDSLWTSWTAVLLSLAAVGLALLLMLTLRRRRTAVPEPSEIPDILGGALKRTHVPESSGVRWDVALYPETLSVPGYVVLTAIVQNAYDQVRTATLGIDAGTLLPQGHECSFALKPGEAGVLRIPLFLSRTLTPGDYELRARLTARAPQGEGRRLLPRPSRSDRGPRKAFLRVLSAHDRPPVNLLAYDWKGFTSLYIPPQTAPDLTDLKILEELPSFPEKD